MRMPGVLWWLLFSVGSVCCCMHACTDVRTVHLSLLLNHSHVNLFWLLPLRTLLLHLQEVPEDW
jgi:hypothetical protein